MDFQTGSNINFLESLKRELLLASDNFFEDNYEYLGKGKKRTLKRKVVDWVKKPLFSKKVLALILRSESLFNKILLNQLAPFMERLDSMYQLLEDDRSKKLLVQLIAYRILDYQKVKLPYNDDSYWATINDLDSKRESKDNLKINYNPWVLYKYHVDRYNLSLYCWTIGCLATFIREQYKYVGENFEIKAEKGDVVLDLGGCFGDTALYFASLVGESGRVYVYEFVEETIEIFDRNIALNPNLANRIELVKHPVWDKSGIKTYYNSLGGNSKVSFEEFSGYDGTAETLSVDDFVEQYKIEKLDFLKTDIEGAEPFALKGAIKTIRRFKPKLSISIYHNMSDFTEIIHWLDELDLGYKFYLNHSSIHSGETNLFCQAN